MQRCMKRIDEFADDGYDVVAYGFDCGVAARVVPKSVTVNVLGEMSFSWSHLKRMVQLYKGINKVLKFHKKENVLYYIFGLDKGIIFQLFGSHPYIFEESDLTHTYSRYRIAVSLLEFIDKIIIKKSTASVFTSEGFLNYHYGEKRPNNTFVIANRLPFKVLELPKVVKRPFDSRNLSIGFVGFIRFKSIYNFAKVIGEYFPDLTFHFFGSTNNKADEKMFMHLQEYHNIVFHGAFKHPIDLPEVYSQIDLVLSTYDVENENVRYAEPNKIYESIWFKTPIIVSSGTFLAKKVNDLGIGYAIDPLNDNEVKEFIKNLSMESIEEKKKAIDLIDPYYAINDNAYFFSQLKKIICQ